MEVPALKQQHFSNDGTVILLVRHGHVEGIDPARFRGQRELPLTALGRRQAQALSRRIALAWQPDAIFTSPLGRCVETADVVAQPFGLMPEPVPDLIDLDYGAWQGMTGAEVHARWPEDWTRWRRTPQFMAFPNGENMQGLAARSAKALHDILHAQHGRTIVLVAHDSVNRVLLLHALDLPLAHYRAIKQSPCGLNVLEFDGGRFTVRTLNETGHLLGC